MYKFTIPIIEQATIPVIERAFEPLAWSNGIVPLPANAEVEKLVRCNAEGYCLQYGYTLPSRELVEIVVSHTRKAGLNKLVGLASGGACLEKFLSLAGLEVVATDIDAKTNSKYSIFDFEDGEEDDDMFLFSYPRGKFCMPVLEMSAAEAIQTYRQHTFFMAWPIGEIWEEIRDVFEHGNGFSSTQPFIVIDFASAADEHAHSTRSECLQAMNAQLVEEIELPRSLHDDEGSPCYLHIFHTLG